MASGFVKVTAIGNLGRDPEMRYTQSGQAVTSFSIASTRKWNGGDGTKREETTWLRCSAWGKLAEVCAEYLAKGRQVYVEGRLQVDANGNPRTFERQDGTTGASFELTVETIQFLGGGNGNGSGQPEQAEEEVVPL